MLGWLFRRKKKEDPVPDDDTNFRMNLSGLPEPPPKPQTPKAEFTISMEYTEIERPPQHLEELVKDVEDFNKSGKIDNLNYETYEGTAIYKETGRKRKVKTEVFPGESPVGEIIKQGFVSESIEIKRVPSAPATEFQLEAMKEHNDPIPNNPTKHDCSTIITRAISDDPHCPDILFEIANGEKFKFSYFNGKNNMIESLWEHYDLTGKISLFMLCLHLNTHGSCSFEAWNKYRQYAAVLSENTTFCNSFKMINERDITDIENISKQKNCYKMAIGYIQ